MNFSGFTEKSDSGSGKPDTRSRNLFVLKHIWVKVSITFKFQPNWSKNTLKSGFFRIFGKSGSRIRNVFGLKPSPDQDRANKKSLAKSAQPFRRRQVTVTHTHYTQCCFSIKMVVRTLGACSNLISRYCILLTYPFNENTSYTWKNRKFAIAIW